MRAVLGTLRVLKGRLNCESLRVADSVRLLLSRFLSNDGGRGGGLVNLSGLLTHLSQNDLMSEGRVKTINQMRLDHGHLL